MNTDAVVLTCASMCGRPLDVKDPSTERRKRKLASKRKQEINSSITSEIRNPGFQSFS